MTKQEAYEHLVDYKVGNWDEISFDEMIAQLVGNEDMLSEDTAEALAVYTGA